jgi:hypothetical protein
MTVSGAPLSELGRLTGRFHLGAKRPLIAMNCYFDGSIGGNSDQWMTLASIVASDRAWAPLQSDWEIMLKSRYPVAPYIHMTDLITGNDPFERLNGWTDEKVDGLVSDAETLLNSVDKSQMYSAVFSIDKKACDRVRADGHPVPDPSVVCAEFCIYHPLGRYVDNNGLELAYLFYDQDEPYISSIRSRWNEHRKKLISDNIFWGSVANVQPVDMRATPPIQIADMLAWAATRRILNLPTDKWSRLANSLVGTRQYGGILHCTQVDPITEDEIRRRYPKS